MLALFPDFSIITTRKPVYYLSDGNDEERAEPRLATATVACRAKDPSCPFAPCCSPGVAPSFYFIS